MEAWWKHLVASPLRRAACDDIPWHVDGSTQFQPHLRSSDMFSGECEGDRIAARGDCKQLAKDVLMYQIQQLTNDIVARRIMLGLSNDENPEGLVYINVNFPADIPSADKEPGVRARAITQSIELLEKAAVFLRESALASGGKTG